MRHFLIGQHIALTDQRAHSDPNYVGIICTKTNVRDLAQEAIENARFVCEDHYGLFDAPKVVKQVATMSWQYISAPQDGTVFLSWIGNRMQNQFPTDGYVWVDPEQRYTQDFGGYVCRIYFLDQVATH